MGGHRRGVRAVPARERRRGLTPDCPDRVTTILLALRLTSLAGTPQVVQRTGLSSPAVVETLGALAEQGWVRHREGRLTGWALTPAGREAGERSLAAEVAARGGRADLETLYERFRQINPVLLRVCTDWQVRETDGREVPNDHSDREYDAAVVGRLEALHGVARPLAGELGGLIDRFAGYGPRLDDALARVRAGSHEWFCRPSVDSYHTVWFEWHEHLLATLGRRRTDEVDGLSGESGRIGERG